MGCIEDGASAWEWACGGAVKTSVGRVVSLMVDRVKASNVIVLDSTIA